MVLNLDGRTSKIMNLDSLDDRWASFRWNVVKCNGYDFENINNAFDSIKENKKPTVIIAYTIKGKGISFMEDNIAWHGTVPSK